MSSKGNPYDNAMAEKFFSILKTECIYRHKPKTFREANDLIDRYIHFYNYERFQERFETRTPMEVRTEALNSDAPALYPIPENKRIQKYKEKFAA